MSAADVLGAAAPLALADCVRGALHFALSLSDPASVLPTASLARDAIDFIVKRTIALEMRRLNASTKKQLPVELWSNIWELLSDDDRISVSRVCGHWREMYYACPSLWKNLRFYTTCHSSLCKCPPCSGSLVDQFTSPSGWQINPYPEHSTNFSGAVAALARSRALPLDISVDVVPFTANQDVVNFLVDALLPHVARLTTLRLRVCKPADIASFLARFDSLPALRVLELDTVPDSRSDMHMSGSHRFITRDIALPALEELHVHSTQLMWPDGATMQYSLLRKLTAHCNQGYSTERILRGAPGLVSLRILLTSDEPYFLGTLQPLLQSMPLVDVEVSGLSKNGSARRVVPTFNPPTRQLHRFSLGLSRWYDDIIPWNLLDELGADIRLTSSRTDTRYELRGTDNTGRVRTIWRIPMSIRTEPFLSHASWLPSDRTVSFSADAFEWVKLLSLFPKWPRIENLTITFFVDADIAAVPQDRAKLISFPVLRSVTVSILAKDVQVTAENIVAFLRLLQLPAPLEDLRIDRRVRDYDSELFSSFAQRVRIE